MVNQSGSLPPSEVRFTLHHSTKHAGFTWWSASILDGIKTK